MKVKDAVEYLFAKAQADGYTESQLDSCLKEICHIINLIPDCSYEVLDRVYEEYF